MTAGEPIVLKNKNDRGWGKVLQRSQNRNSFESYRNAGITRTYNIGNIGFIRGQSATYVNGKYIPTTDAKSYGFSINAFPSIFYFSNTGGNTWIPFY